MEENAITHYMPYIVVFNFLVVAALLMVFAKMTTGRELTEGAPDGRQNLAEFVLDFFVGKAREIGDTKVVMTVAPFLATCFLFILLSNLMGMLPLPVFNNPPTAFYSVPLGLALCAVVGTMIISGVFNGLIGAFKHLVWPNPLQFIAEITDVLSLSLRLFGNIGGEHMTLVLVMTAVPFGIPLILHVLGLIPAFVQALVFTLLTTSFIAGAVHHEHEAETVHEHESHAEDEELEKNVVEGPPVFEGEPAAAIEHTHQATPG